MITQQLRTPEVDGISVGLTVTIGAYYFGESVGRDESSDEQARLLIGLVRGLRSLDGAASGLQVAYIGDDVRRLCQAPGLGALNPEQVASTLDDLAAAIRGTS